VIEQCLAGLRDNWSVCAQGAMGLGVRMKAAAGEKLLLAAHSSHEMCALSSRNIAKFWGAGCPDTGVASIGASSIHTFTAESSQVFIGKCSNCAEGEEEEEEEGEEGKE